MFDDDDNFLGSEDDLSAVVGDELDLADTVSRLNPVADQLQHFAQMRRVKHGLLNQQAPFARTNPPSILKGSLGNQAQLAVSFSSGQVPPWSPVGSQESRVAAPVQLANWVGEDAETTDITITVAPVFFTPTRTTTIQPRPYAVIEFGTRGSLAQFEVDVGRGVQLTVTGSSATVTGGLESPTNLVVIPNPGEDFSEFAMMGMISFKPVTHRPPLTRTRYGASTAGGSSYRFRVPPFARSLRFWRDAIGVTAYRLEFEGLGSGSEYEVTVAAGAALLNEIPLATGVEFINVVRTDADPGANFETFIFDLAF